MRKTKKKGGSSTQPFYAPEAKPESNVVKPKSMKNRAKNAASSAASGAKSVASSAASGAKSVASGVGKAASWIGNKLSLKKKKKVNPDPNTNCVPYKPTPLQILKKKKRDCYKILKKYNTIELVISLNALKDKIKELNNKTSNMKKDTKKKVAPDPTRCDSEEISFMKLNKLFKYSINVLESALKRMDKLVIPEQNKDDCPENSENKSKNKSENKSKNKSEKNKSGNISNAYRIVDNKLTRNVSPANSTSVGPPVANVIPGIGLNKLGTGVAIPVAAIPGSVVGEPVRAGAAPNDTCDDYNEIRQLVKNIINQIEPIINMRDFMVSENCDMTISIFDKLSQAKSEFENVNKKLNSDKRLPTNVQNGSIVARKNGKSNKINEKASI